MPPSGCGKKTINKKFENIEFTELQIFPVKVDISRKYILLTFNSIRYNKTLRKESNNEEIVHRNKFIQQ